MGKSKTKNKPVVAPEAKLVYRVAKGRSLVSRAGILVEGDEVKPHYMNGNIDDLVAKGHVVKG